MKYILVTIGYRSLLESKMSNEKQQADFYLV